MTGDDPYRPGQTNSRGQIICGAKKRSKHDPGGVCKSPVKTGHTRCRRHGGATTKSAKAARKRNQNTAATKAMTALGYNPEGGPVDPAEALLNLIGHKHREVAWLRGMINEITQSDNPEKHPLVWAISKHTEGLTPEGPTDLTEATGGLNIWVQWLHTAEKQLADISAKALQIGIQQRQLEIKQTEALAFVGALNSIFAALNLSNEQQAKIPEIVPAVMKQLDQKAAA